MTVGVLGSKRGAARLESVNPLAVVADAAVVAAASASSASTVAVHEAEEVGDTEEGMTVVVGGKRYYTDGPGGRPLAAGWVRHDDDDDGTQYSHTLGGRIVFSDTPEYLAAV